MQARYAGFDAREGQGAELFDCGQGTDFERDLRDDAQGSFRRETKTNIMYTTLTTRSLRHSLLRSLVRRAFRSEEQLMQVRAGGDARDGTVLGHDAFGSDGREVNNQVFNVAVHALLHARGPGRDPAAQTVPKEKQKRMVKTS